MFFAFVIAVLAAMFGSDKLRGQFATAFHGLDQLTWPTLTKWLAILLAAAVPYAIVWTERQISRIDHEKTGSERKGSERSAYVRIAVFFLAAFVLFLYIPANWRSAQWSPSSTPILDFTFRDVFGLAGVALLVSSAFLLFISMEFYDTASGWRGSLAVHFHHERIGSHSYVLGIMLALVGFFLLLSFLDEAFGRILALIAILIAASLSEMERALWRGEGKQASGSGQT